MKEYRLTFKYFTSVAEPKIEGRDWRKRPLYIVFGATFITYLLVFVPLQEWGGYLWFLIALLGTRRVFRLVIPKTALYPNMGHYVIAFFLVSFWWWFVGFILYLIL